MVGAPGRLFLSIAIFSASVSGAIWRVLGFAEQRAPPMTTVETETQDSSNLSSDTLELAAVNVWSASWKKFTVGQPMQTHSKEDMQDFEGLGLADFLQAKSSLFLRQNGPGMLASLTMRGTSAGHNAVFWNGLPINSPSLGQSDFSILPIGGFDEVELHFGGGAALFGTDAIGGSVHLNSRLRFEQGHGASVATLLGSFGRWNQSAAYTFSNKNFSSRFKAFRNHAKNNFPFRDLSRPGTPVLRQEHARVDQWGFLQDMAWKIRDNQQISSSFWWNDTDRQIQPVIGSNTQDVQQDKNLRWALDYFCFWGQTSLNIKTGWVRDDQTFNIASRNLTDQLLSSADVDWTLSSKWFFKSGIRYTYIIGNLSTYAARESRTEVYHASRYQAHEKVSISFNMRQLVYDANFAPFTPSFGLEWDFLKTRSHLLTGMGSISRAFKVPTLNDRFWVPGGNLDLIPEESWSGEIGLVHRYTQDRTGFEQRLTRYRMSVDNWIIWLPNGNIWSPENIRAVLNDGLEYTFEISQEMPLDWVMEVSGNYAWTRAIQTAAATENDAGLGKQLPYTPIHKVQGIASLSKGNLRAFANNQWISERYVTTDNNSSVVPYYLLDLGTQYQWRFGPLEGMVGFQINNLLDREYQIMRLQAMPGRNYQINLNISL